MLNAIIVDDEFHARATLEMKLEEYCPEVTLVGLCENISDAISAVRDLRPDLVFLDIEMPDGDGFNFCEILQDGTARSLPKIIFVTAHREYAIRALRHGAFDYLLKPVKPHELQQAIARLQRAQNTAAAAETARIRLARDKGFELLDVDQIIRCRASSNYTCLHLRGGEVRIASRNLGEFEEQLHPHGFYRIHKSHLINLREVRSYLSGRGGKVLMSDGHYVEVSARRREAFLEQVRRFAGQ